jgi:hypothetical protein
VCAFEVLIRGGRGGGEATHPAENSIGTGMSGRLSQPRMRTFQRSTVVCTPRGMGYGQACNAPHTTSCGSPIIQRRGH